MGAAVAQRALFPQRGGWGVGRQIRTTQEDRELRQLQSRYDDWDQGGGRGLSNTETSRLRALQGMQKQSPDMNLNRSQVAVENKRREEIRDKQSQTQSSTQSTQRTASEPIIRYVPTPPAPVVARAAVPRMPAQATAVQPGLPSRYQSATGRWVTRTNGKKKTLGRGTGSSSTILTTPQGDLGGTSDFIRKPTLGG